MEMQNALPGPVRYDEVKQQAMFLWKEVFYNHTNRGLSAEEAITAADTASAAFIKTFKETE